MKTPRTITVTLSLTDIEVLDRACDKRIRDLKASAGIREARLLEDAWERIWKLWHEVRFDPEATRPVYEHVEVYDKTQRRPYVEPPNVSAP
jgi:hypothetical protein